MIRLAPISILSVLIIQGCAIGKTSFSCSGIPEGVSCMSAKEVYNATNKANSLAVDRSAKDGAESTDPDRVDSDKTVRTHPDPVPTVDRPIPVRSQAMIMRYWIAPYETEAGDFSAGGLYFKEIEERKWNFAATNVPGAVSGGKTFTPLKPAISGGSAIHKAIVAPLKKIATNAGGTLVAPPVQPITAPSTQDVQNQEVTE